MSELAPIIADLALMLVLAGVMTIIFKKLKQPIVLGYIVAGFLAGPHFNFIPSVVDAENVHVWADIGVIFLLFALGLEFSVKKLMKVGLPAVIAALTIIFGMIFLGIVVGHSFGWQRMDCIFLGGMIAMSSTTIIYKAFDDLGLRKKQFTGLVMSILILEDVLAVVLMVILSTMAATNSVEGGAMFRSIAKLVFFLVLWFVVGLYLVPLFLRKVRPLMNDETLLVVALGLCFAMVVIAASTGFSAAFGAFIMGSILAETLEAEHIDHLVKPVKDLFGAVFFVSVGMMVDPTMIVKFAVPILVVTLAVILGQATFATLGVLLSGRSLKTAMQCGFSLTQIGEFAFIIASLGVSLGVTSDFLYPIVVAVSVITIFLTPYMIKLAEPAYDTIYRILPQRWKNVLDKYATGGAPASSRENLWKKYLMAIVKDTFIYAIIALAVLILCFRLLVPAVQGWIPGIWGNILLALVIVSCMSPFLRAIMIKQNHSEAFTTLWEESRANRAPLVASIIIRVAIAMSFVMYVLTELLHWGVGLIVPLALLLILTMIISRRLKSQNRRMEEIFHNNLRSRELAAEYKGEKQPEYASSLLSKDLHMEDFDIPGSVAWGGRTLMELDFGKRFGVHVVSIIRGSLRINIPKGSDRIFPQDKIQVLGTDSQIEAFGAFLQGEVKVIDQNAIEESEMVLQQFIIGEESPFLGKNIMESGLRNKYHCLIAGVEKPDGQLHSPDIKIPFAVGDVVWIVGEKNDVSTVLHIQGAV